MKKRMLSLALALVMCLGLTVPAFAAENNWYLEVDGKADEEVWSEKTFTLRGWSFSDYDENSMRTVTQTDAEEYTRNCLCPNKGDVMVITNGGEEFYALGLMAWSDPDGDGVYDQRLMKETPAEQGLLYEYELQPADIAGPLTYHVNHHFVPSYDTTFYLGMDGSIGGRFSMYTRGTELRLSADKLLDTFGPNTLVRIRGWYVLVEDGASQPTTPAEGGASQPTPPAESVTPDAPGTYTAKKYDTWGQIALNHYGAYAAWPALYAANGYKAVKAGMVVTLPEKLGNYTRLPAQVLAEGERLYTVKAGDTLGRIAQAVYGDAMQYKAIFQRNADRLKNANTIYEGQIIVLPVISK